MNGSTAAVPAAVTLSADKKVATLKPTLPLQPGRTYTVSLSAAITDTAGAALAATSWSTRTALTIDSTSPAIKEAWDRDLAVPASGGGFTGIENVLEGRLPRRNAVTQGLPGLEHHLVTEKQCHRAH